MFNKGFFLINRKFYRNLIIIFLIPILIISFLSYFGLRVFINTQLKDTSMLYLDQTVNTFEFIIKQVQNNCRQLIADKKFRKYEDFPLGIYYENISGELNIEDLNNLSAYMNNKKEVWDIIDIIKFSNEFIDSVYFFDRQKSIVMTDIGTQFSVDKFYDKVWEKIPSDNNVLFPYMVNRRSMLRENNVTKNVITIIFKSFSNSENYIVVNLDMDCIRKNILNKLGSNENNHILVLNSDKDLIISDDDSIFENNKELFKSKSFNLDKGSFTWKFKNKTNLVTQIKSENLNWKFINIIEIKKFYENTAYLIKFMIIIFAVFIIITVMFCLLSSKRIYLPILELIESISKRKGENGNEEKESLNKKTHCFDEFKFINDNINKVYDERNTLQQKLKEALPAYKEKFILSLLRGNCLEHEDIKKNFNFLNIRLRLDECIVIIISIEEFNEEKNDIESVGIIKIKLKNILEDKLKQRWNGTVINDMNDNFIIIINSNNNEIVDLFQFLEQVKLYIYNNLNISCTIGVGEYCKNIYEIKKSYESAKEALRYKLIIGTNHIIYIEDIRIKKNEIYEYPYNKVESMSDYIKNGDDEKACIMFSEILNDVFNRKNISYRDIQQVFVKILTRIIDTVNEMGLDIDSIFPNSTSLYYELLNKNKIEDIEGCFKNTICKITSSIDKAIVDKNSQYVDKIINILKQNYGYDVSLDSVSEQLNLSPSYISRIFKKVTNKSFVEYLTDIRINESKILLEKSELAIKEVSEKVGYTNSYYFIKIFKKHTGITPGEYRKLL